MKGTGDINTRRGQVTLTHEGDRPALPGKHAARWSTRVSWVTALRATFMAEMARHRISPSGMNWDWLIGDMLIGDTSPAGAQRGTGTKSQRERANTNAWRNTCLVNWFKEPGTIRRWLGALDRVEIWFCLVTNSERRIDSPILVKKKSDVLILSHNSAPLTHLVLRPSTAFCAY